MRRPLLTAILTLGLALTCVPLGGNAQHAAGTYRLGYLGMARGPDGRDTRLDMFREGLRDLGYVEGRNITLEVLYAEGKPEIFPDLAADLVRLKVNVIVTSTGVAAIAAQKATQTIPIVMWASGDAVRQGLIQSLARPGGNVTGFTMASPDLSRKRLEVLREVLPKLSRVGVLWCGGSEPVGKQQWAETQSAADVLRVELSSFRARGREDLSKAFASAARQRVDALLVFDCSSLHPSAARMAELSVKHRLPTMYPFPYYPQVGGLMSYGASDLDTPYRAASYVDKILKGAKPGDLPVEQPRKFELIINLKAAKALGLTIPPSVLMRAEQVIN